MRSTLTIPFVLNIIIRHNHLRLVVPISITLSFSISLSVDVTGVVSWGRSRWRMASLMMSTTFFHTDDLSSLLVRALKLDGLGTTFWFGVTSAFLRSLIIHDSLITAIMVAADVHGVVWVDVGTLRNWILVHSLHLHLLLLLLQGFIPIFISVILCLVVTILYSFVATTLLVSLIVTLGTSSWLVVAFSPLWRLLIWLGIWVILRILTSWWVSKTFTVHLISVSVFISYGRRICFWFSTRLPCWLIF